MVHSLRFASDSASRDRSGRRTWGFRVMYIQFRRCFVRSSPGGSRRRHVSVGLSSRFGPATATPEITMSWFACRLKLAPSNTSACVREGRGMTPLRSPSDVALDGKGAVKFRRKRENWRSPSYRNITATPFLRCTREQGKQRSIAKTEI